MQTHFKLTEKFQYTHFKSSHPPSVKKGFIKGEALRLLITCSSKEQFESNTTDFKIRLRNRGYPETLITNTLAEINFDNRSVALKQEPKARKKILPFVTKFNAAALNIKFILMKNWFLIQNQPEL